VSWTNGPKAVSGGVESPQIPVAHYPEVHEGRLRHRGAEFDPRDVVRAKAAVLGYEGMRENGVSEVMPSNTKVEVSYTMLPVLTSPTGVFKS